MNAVAYRLTKYELETIINFNEAEKTADVFTYNSTLINKLSALCDTHNDEIQQTKVNSYGGTTYTLPKKWIKIKPPRVLSEKQRATLDNINAKRKSNSMI